MEGRKEERQKMMSETSEWSVNEVKNHMTTGSDAVHHRKDTLVAYYLDTSSLEANLFAHFIPGLYCIITGMLKELGKTAQSIV